MQDERQWDEDIEDELKEAEEDEKQAHAQRMEEYRKELESWKKQRLAKVRHAYNLYAYVHLL